MNFFKLYIGDYQRDTAHLSVTEHGAYLLMLQHYYATEKPLPTGKALHRMLRAQDKTERDAIDAVASAFWRATDEGLVNDRASDEIGKAEHQRTVNRSVGKLGGRPKRTETESVTESGSEREPNDNPNQTPDKEIPPIPPEGGKPEAPSAQSQQRQKPERKAAAVGLKAWLADRKAAGEAAIPDDDPVVAYADEVGIPSEFLRLAWLEFRTRYSQPEAKRYRDWRAVFRKAVRGNWLRLWFVGSDGSYGLTTVGHQAQRANEERRAA